MKKAIAIILALTMAFAGSSISFADDSYIEYFSEESFIEKTEDNITMIVSKNNEFICMNNEDGDMILNYTPEFDIKFIVPYGDYIMLSSEEPDFDNNGEILTWGGKYIGIDTLTGEEFSISDPMMFYLLASSGIENNVNYPVTINGKSIPHPSYPNGSDQYEGTYTSTNAWGSGQQCQGFGLLIYDYLWFSRL